MSPCQTFIETLSDRGFRITRPRRMIIEVIAHNGYHCNAEQVFAQLQEASPTVNIATVYRTLDLLVEQGLASRVILDGGRIIYATHQHGPHIHLVCRQCGIVIDANPGLLSAFDKRLQSDYQFAADLQHISVAGLCKDCQGQ